MLTVEINELQAILAEYEITETVTQVEELLRYNYENHDPDSREVRLILKLLFLDRNPLVIKFKNEMDVTGELIEKQTEFSQHLLESGVPTAHFYRSLGKYVINRSISGYGVLITLEDFMNGEIKTIDPSISEKTGRLLALMHTIAEKDDCHVQSPVLFDPFAKNDLFSFEKFTDLRCYFHHEDASRFTRICETYQSRMRALGGICAMKKYAVQGDISNCNLYETNTGEVGVFDFNRCGENVLFCDAIMQGIFQSRLMDYDRELTKEYSELLFDRFLMGYHHIRPFTLDEREAISHLYAVVSAFWLPQIEYDDNSISKLLEEGKDVEASMVLEKIARRITADRSF